ncbi:hypothetical protein ACVWZA_003255 [Sphingomonas sp. UYAg733]
MRYFSQGDHDGLCGFFAVLNAFRFLQQSSGHSVLIDNDTAFFDEAVECLARVPGVDIRVLKSNPAIGGIDQFQIRDLCALFAERIDLGITVGIIGPRQRMPFARRYRSLWRCGKAFGVIAAHRDGSHWIVAARHNQDAYLLIDEGTSRSIPLKPAEEPKLAADAAVILALF